MTEEIKKALQEFFGLTFPESLGRKHEELENKVGEAKRYALIAAVMSALAVLLILIK